MKSRMARAGRPRDIQVETQVVKYEWRSNLRERMGRTDGASRLGRKSAEVTRCIRKKSALNCFASLHPQMAYRETFVHIISSILLFSACSLGSGPSTGSHSSAAFRTISPHCSNDFLISEATTSSISSGVLPTLGPSLAMIHNGSDSKDETTVNAFFPSAFADCPFEPRDREGRAEVRRETALEADPGDAMLKRD